MLPRNAADHARGKELFCCWARAVTDMGGAVSAEHGVGKIKRDFLAVMYGEGHLREMARLKCQLDPQGLLGRGNLFSAELLDEERAACAAAAGEKGCALDAAAAGSPAGASPHAAGEVA